VSQWVAEKGLKTLNIFNTTIIGFGCAPFFAAFYATSLSVYIFAFLPKIVVWLLVLFYFAKAPLGFLARYLPVALPLVLTLVVPIASSAIVANGSFAPEAFSIPLYFNIAFFSSGLCVENSSSFMNGSF